MALDANIILQGKLPEFQNPLAKYAQVAQLEQAQNTNALAQYSLAKAQREDVDTNAIRNILKNAGGDMDAGQNALMKGGYYEKALALKKSQQEQSKTESEIARNKAAAGETQAKAVAKSAETYRDLLSNVNDPKTAAQWVQAGYAHPVLGPIFSQHGTMEQSLAMIPQDPAAFAGWKRENALGASKFAEVSKPTIQTRNTGGSTDTLAIDPFTGKVAVTNSVRNTMSPDAIAADARGRQQLAQSERHFQAGQNAPQYMETDAGLVALPKKLAPGQAPTGTPVMGADGQALGKPLKPIPPSANSAIIANAQATNQIDRALKLLSGENIGDPAQGGMQGDANATGWKGYLPNGMLNRMDPKGVSTRAEVSDIGSLKIHDRSGAAVTLSEAPRLMPFIPLATDDAATVRKKLARLRTELANESTALSETYSKDQGYKPSPVKPASSAGNGVPDDIAALIKKHGGK